MRSPTLETVLFIAALAAMAIVLLMALPLGLESPGIVRYWNNDDANILSYYGPIYSRIVIPPVDYIGYPFFYYYISGAIVVPAALFLGALPETVALGWRLSNIIFFLGTNALLFHIGRRYFKQPWAGLVAIFLYSTLQITFVFILRFKPSTCETFLNLLIMVLCFRMLETFRFKEWIALAVLTGFSFSTKYHALYLLPIIYGALAAKLHRAPLPDARAKRLIRRGASAAAATTVLCGLLWAAALYLAEHRVAYADTWSAFKSADRIFRTYIIDHIVRYSGFLFAGAIIVLAIQTLIAGRSRIGRTVGVANSYFLLFLAVFGATVVITNPYFLVYPDETLDVFFRMYQIIYDGTGWDRSMVDGAGWGWFGVLASPPVLGRIGAAFFACYFFFEVVLGGGRADFSASRSYRMVLLGHVLLYGGYLIASVGLKKHHYLGPIIPDIALLSGFALAASIGSLQSRVLRNAGGYFVAALLAISVAERWPVIRHTLRYELGKESDQGLIAARWINAHYPQDTTMLSDLGTLGYIADVTLVSGAYRSNIDDMKRHLRTASPRLIAITRSNTAPLIDELSSTYRVVYSDVYTGTHDEIEMVRLLERRSPMIESSENPS